MRNQPSAVNVCRVASGLFQYPGNTTSPRARISPSSAMRISTPGNGRPTVPIRFA